MQTPNVLALAGHDPTGGAGIQADIESIAANGGHALGLITALTVQDTHNVTRVQTVAPALLAEQAEALLGDCLVSAVKIGLLSDVAQLPLIAGLIRRLQVPVVLDPILRAGGGAELQGRALTAAVRETLFPLTTILVPNAAEARRLTGSELLEQAGRILLEQGAAQVLITGGDEPGADATENLWFVPGQKTVCFRWTRLPWRFHGAGCTLASALATQLAHGLAPGEALQAAQAYTHEALRNSRSVGQGRRVPGRVPRVDAP